MLESQDIIFKRFDSFKKAKSFINKETIVIVDEFDYQFFDKIDTDPFELFLMNYQCLVALTATRPSQEEALFSSIYKKIEFHNMVDHQYDIKHEERTNFTNIDSL